MTISIRSLLLIIGIFLSTNFNFGCRKDGSALADGKSSNKVIQFPVGIADLRDGGTREITVYGPQEKRVRVFYLAYSTDKSEHGQLFSRDDWSKKNREPLSIPDGIILLQEVMDMLEQYYGKSELAQIVSNRVKGLNDFTQEELEQSLVDRKLRRELDASIFVQIFETYHLMLVEVK